MANNNEKIIPGQPAKFSKDNPIVEISSKQSQVQTQNVIPPVIPKESKKERGN